MRNIISTFTVALSFTIPLTVAAQDNATAIEGMTITVKEENSRTIDKTTSYRKDEIGLTYGAGAIVLANRLQTLLDDARVEPKSVTPWRGQQDVEWEIQGVGDTKQWMDVDRDGKTDDDMLILARSLASQIDGANDGVSTLRYQSPQTGRSLLLTVKIDGSLEGRFAPSVRGPDATTNDGGDIAKPGSSPKNTDNDK